tara:strand:- start:573 stop:734 length:162 start_codon:yes stop_codon:yes gene_type:complete
MRPGIRHARPHAEELVLSFAMPGRCPATFQPPITVVLADKDSGVRLALIIGDA